MITGSRRLRLTTVLLFLCLPAIGSGGELLDAIVKSPLVVVGTVDSTRKLDLHGRFATLAIEQRLNPGERSRSSINVVWEELAPSLPDRLKPGQRVLLALEPLPTASIWKRRMPDEKTRASVVHVARAGRALLKRPATRTVDRIQHWLALDSKARAGDAGQLLLSQMVPRAAPELARECVAAIDTKALEGALSPALTQSVLAALDREEAGIARAMAKVLERRQPKGFARILEARVSERGVDATASLLYAAGALGATVPELSSDAKLGPGQRRALTRWRQGAEADRELEQLMIGDSDPQIRAAAVQRFMELRGIDGLTGAFRVFDDAEPAVRAASVNAVAELGPDAVLPLIEFATRESGEPARAAIATLSLMGPKGHLALARLADTHEDQDIRFLASVAIGRPVGHTD